METFWKLQSRLICPNESIFKLRRISQNKIIFNLPRSNQVIATPFHFNNQQFVRYKFSNSPQAIQHVNILGHQYIIAGCINGTIEGKILDKSLENAQNIIPNFNLGQGILEEGQNYINDICKLRLAQNKIINCYNNGTLAIWDLIKRQRIHRIPNVHYKYTYKIRNIQQRVFSCGNDKYAVVTDLQVGSQLTSFCHEEPVWCVQPLQYNLIATVGLFGRILMWDVRSNKIVQSCQLQGHQSSFVTQLNPNYLTTGDQNKLIKADIRKFIRQPLCKDVLLTSAEHILITEEYHFIADRRFELCRLSNSTTFESNPQCQFLQFNPDIDNVQLDSDEQQLVQQVEQNQQLQQQNSSESSDSGVSDSGSSSSSISVNNEPMQIQHQQLNQESEMIDQQSDSSLVHENQQQQSPNDQNFENAD